MGRRMVLTALALPVIALLGYAWVDGGRQPLRDIDQSLSVPQAHS
jgi:hypothetical protein